MSALLFYPLAALAVAGALGVVLARNPVRSALSLVVTLFFLAVFYVFLQAHLVAALQIIVYAGAVMVLFLFVITLLNLESDHGINERPALSAAGFVAGAIVAVLLVKALLDSTVPGGRGVVLDEAFGTTKVLARQLFSEYLVAFELTSILLLVAVVGAVVLAKRTVEEDARDNARMMAAAEHETDEKNRMIAAHEAAHSHLDHGHAPHSGHGHVHAPAGGHR
ncbi:MAG TPA: NADH-quinone oxidoreductase subunit J [Candidatus Limnocylindrales bacterium]|nr:NADH-quinone oxidoreductase subunit J [Candidatus Limnocylindrales bacterium]